MRRPVSALVLVVFAIACSWAQHGQPTDPHDTKAGSPNQDSTPALSHADKSLACPVSITPYNPPFGVFKLGAGIQGPKLLNNVSASFPKEDRELMREAHLKSFDADSVLLVVVGTDGNPRYICVKKPAGYGLDGEAYKAAQKYRFAPARNLGGTPVPVIIAVEIKFRTH
jgi:hypothetical protein